MSYDTVPLKKTIFMSHLKAWKYGVCSTPLRSCRAIGLQKSNVFFRYSSIFMHQVETYPYTQYRRKNRTIDKFGCDTFQIGSIGFFTVIFEPGANRTSDSFCHSSQRSLWKGPELLSKIGIVTFSRDGASLKGKMCQTLFNWRQGFHYSRQGCWNCDIWASYMNVLWQSP